eukprot:TRINITY_DN3450_c0_g1_i1.p1 TRINITY_DN3450_c0_g1~~TRINITY_DN3450_c0_g1_i1.p1  ORF type:complete len:1318 (-),score=351.90 TRINITY_DN3450_c0_g1_i1:414-4367(-)
MGEESWRPALDNAAVILNELLFTLKKDNDTARENVDLTTYPGPDVIYLERRPSSVTKGDARRSPLRTAGAAVVLPSADASPLQSGQRSLSGVNLGAASRGLGGGYRAHGFAAATSRTGGGYSPAATGYPSSSSTAKLPPAACTPPVTPPPPRPAMSPPGRQGRGESAFKSAAQLRLTGGSRMGFPSTGAAMQPLPPPTSTALVSRESRNGRQSDGAIRDLVGGSATLAAAQSEDLAELREQLKSVISSSEPTATAADAQMSASRPSSRQLKLQLGSRGLDTPGTTLTPGCETPWTTIDTSRTSQEGGGGWHDEVSEGVVNQVVDTCFKLESVLKTAPSPSRSRGPAVALATPTVSGQLGGLATPSSLVASGRLATPSSSPPAQLFTARAAKAAARSAELASAAAADAVAACQVAAEEATRAAAAAKAACGRYDHIVNWLLENGQEGVLQEVGVSIEEHLALESARRSAGSLSDRDTVRSIELVLTDGQNRQDETQAWMQGELQKIQMAALDDLAAEPEGLPAPVESLVESVNSSRLCSNDTSGDSDSDGEDEGMDSAKFEAEDDLEDLNVDFEQNIAREVFDQMLVHLDLDPEEGDAIYERIREEMLEKGMEDDHGGYAMIEFLEELHIDRGDRAGVETFLKTLRKAEAEVAASGGCCAGRRDEVHASSILGMFDKVVHTLDRRHIAPEEAWKISQAGEVEMSRAERRALQTFEGREEEFLEKVRGHMVEPPIVNATAGQSVCSERCREEVARLSRECRERGEKFTDSEWDITSAASKVLYVDGQSPGWDCTVAQPAGFKRLTEIVANSSSGAGGGGLFGGGGGFGSLFGGSFGGDGGARAEKVEQKPMLFKGSVKPGDICQGQIGTCFLLGAIGAMASQREACLLKMFIKYDVELGIYGIRFNKDGEWSYVIVDDWFPVDEDGQLLYARCADPQEVWVPLLEKAFCKLHTCFEMCDGGLCSEAIFAFFGGVSGQFAIRKQHRREPRRYFKIMKQAMSRGWLLTSAFVPQPGASSQGGGKCGEDLLPCGLVGGHAYSVLKVVEAQGQQLVCCRNPWGSGEWTGKWSDANECGEWTEEMISATGFTEEDDGKFWMSIEDFVANSAGAEYARTFGPDWMKVSSYQNFLPSALEATAVRVYRSKRKDELALAVGDEIVLETCADSYWSGRLKDGRRGHFPARCVKLKERSVLRFDLIAEADTGEQGDMTAVVMLMRPDVKRLRRYTERDDGLTYKDLSYGHMQLVIVAPDGSLSIKKAGYKRCVWGEVALTGSGQWRVYALSADGRGSPCTVRCYLKGGSMRWKEVAGATLSEIADLLDD